MRMERYDSTHALRKFRAANRLTSSARVVECRFVNRNPVIMIKQIPRRFDEALRMWGGFPLFMTSPTLPDELILVESPRLSVPRGLPRYSRGTHGIGGVLTARGQWMAGRFPCVTQEVREAARRHGRDGAPADRYCLLPVSPGPVPPPKPPPE